MILGCAWYPEHWDETRWADDLQLMRQAGLNMVRVGEFAWSRLEPQEGRFDFDWLERAIALAGKFGIATVLGTPTAAPPAWLTQSYPEVLAIREDGRRAQHGARCHFSPTSILYRKFCRTIAEQMARRFGMNPHIIGWQIDNEYNSVSYDDETRPTVPAVAAAILRHAGRVERALDDRLLERRILRLVADSAPHRLAKSRADAGFPSLHHRCLP